MRLSSVDDLRSVYRPPGRGPVDKVIHSLDRHCVDFLAKSPFFILSTANADGVCDVSPKGGPSGFVQVLDEQRLGWADLSGNNRLDSFQNLVTNDSVALLFMIPGLDETLRIVAAELPSAACIVKDHARIDADVETIEAARKQDLQTTLWQPGGSAD